MNTPFFKHTSAWGLFSGHAYPVDSGGQDVIETKYDPAIT